MKVKFAENFASWIQNYFCIDNLKKKKSCFVKLYRMDVHFLVWLWLTRYLFGAKIWCSLAALCCCCLLDACFWFVNVVAPVCSKETTYKKQFYGNFPSVRLLLCFSFNFPCLVLFLPFFLLHWLFHEPLLARRPIYILCLCDYEFI